MYVQHSGSAFAPFVERVAAYRKSHGYAAITYHEATGSTNTDAQPLLGDPAYAGATIAADYQTAGAGRKGRSWIAAPGSSLLFTTLLRAPLDPAALWALPLWTALAVADGIEAACGVRVELKWPNDLLLGGGKCAGRLCVSRVSGERAHVACGIGIDVKRPSEAALAEIVPPPSFLEDAAPAVKREAVLAAVLDRFDADETAFAGVLYLLVPLETALYRQNDVARRWEARAQLAGTEYHVRFDADGSERTGIARRLNATGALVLDDHGTEFIVDLADARVVRG